MNQSNLCIGCSKLLSSLVKILVLKVSGIKSWFEVEVLESLFFQRCYKPKYLPGHLEAQYSWNIYNIQGGPKKSLWCDLEEKCFEIQKCFSMESFSLYIHIFSRS